MPEAICNKLCSTQHTLPRDGCCNNVAVQLVHIPSLNLCWCAVFNTPRVDHSFIQLLHPQDPPGGGLSPAAVIASFATYRYSPNLTQLAVEALNAFAILQVCCDMRHAPFLLDSSSLRYKRLQSC
jgi:hypothetical protein